MPDIFGPGLLKSEVRGGEWREPLGLGKSSDMRPPALGFRSSVALGLSRNGDGWRGVGTEGD